MSTVEISNPYVGPRAFRSGEQLFGRDREVGRLVNLIVAERIVLFYSPSGAGKTSLIQAALIPRLLKMKFEVLPIIRVNQPGLDFRGDNNKVNCYVLSTLLSLDENQATAQRTSLDQLTTLDLVGYLEQRPKPEGARNIEILIFDQFEEILTLDPADQLAKQEFFRQVGEALKAPNRWALFTMREEFVAALDPYRLSIPNQFNTTFRLDLLGEEAARLAIGQPSRNAGVTFEKAAVDKLVDDLRRVRVQQPDGTLQPQLGPYVEPVQLQVVCYRLWETSRPDPQQITENDLAMLGSMDRSLVDQSLADYYAQRVNAIDTETGISQRTIREWFDHYLITEQGLRGTVLMGPERSGGLDNRAIRPLIDAHLVRAEKRSGATWFELAHDRLIGPVRTDNAAWFKANLSLLQKQADVWNDQGRLESLLLRSKDLKEAEKWAAANPAELLPAEKEYLSASRSLHNRERRTIQLAGLITVLVIAALASAIIAFKADLDSQRQERLAFAGQLAAISFSGLEKLPQRSLLLAVEANFIKKAGELSPAAAEDALRAALKSPHGLPLPGHTGPINAVAFSPDGRWLATASDDMTVRLWRLNDHGVEGEAQVLNGHTGKIKVLSFSPDGHWLATGSDDKTVRLWDLSDPAQLNNPHILNQNDPITALAFSPDGRWLASGDQNGVIYQWDMNAPDSIENGNRLQIQNGWIQTLVFSPDGRWLAAGGPRAVWLWDRKAPDLTASLRNLVGHTGIVQALDFSMDGRWLASGSQDKTARLWDLTSPDPALNPKVLSGHSDWVNALAFSPDSRWLATGGRDKMAQLWDVSSPDPSVKSIILPGHTGPIRTLAYSRDGKWLASGNEDHTICLWEVKSGPPGVDPEVLSGHDDRINAIAFSPDSRRLASGGRDNIVRLWDLADTVQGEDPLVLDVRPDGINRLAFSQDGRWLATGGAGPTARLWDLDTDNGAVAPIDLPASNKWVQTLAFSPDGRWLATGGGDATARLWHMRFKNPTENPITLIRHTGEVKTLAFSPDGRWLATGSADKTALLWDLHSSDPSANPKILPGHQGAINSLAFSLDGHWLVTGSADNTARLWDLTSADPAANPVELLGHKDDIFVVAFSPDGRWLATGSGDTTVRLWDLGTAGPNTRSIELSGHADQIKALAFSPDGRWLATGSWDTTVRLWDLKSADPAANPIVLSGHEDWVNVLAFSPDSRWLASGGQDKKVILWDMTISNPGSNPVVLSDHVGEINTLAFSPDGRWLTTGSADQTVRRWSMRKDELENLACLSAGRNLSQKEWDQYFPGRSYHKTCSQWPAGG